MEFELEFGIWNFEFCILNFELEFLNFDVELLNLNLRHALKNIQQDIKDIPPAAAHNWSKVATIGYEELMWEIMCDLHLLFLYDLE